MTKESCLIVFSGPFFLLRGTSFYEYFFYSDKTLYCSAIFLENLRALFSNRIFFFPSSPRARDVISVESFSLWFPQGHDWKYGVARTAEYLHALQDGQFPPFWASNFYGGYGSPSFFLCAAQ